jgi:hypothetical protein
VQRGICAYEEEIELPLPRGDRTLLEHLAAEIAARLDSDLVPIRLAVVESGPRGYLCELGVVSGLGPELRDRVRSIFGFRRRGVERTAAFTTVFVVPTGIGCVLGGHAGDANVAAQLLAAVSDRLVTHPNVVNASDVNELPPNGLYVEGSILASLLMGTVGLQPVRSNRVLALVDEHPEERFKAAAVNSVSAARACYGLRSAGVALLDPPLSLCSRYAPSGRATGVVTGLERVVDVLDRRQGEYDAVALSTQIDVPFSYHLDYYEQAGAMINPWGGVEALLTHTLSCLFGLPSAHSPMFASDDVAALDQGIVDPRMAAEVISLGFFMSVLKGLQRSPRIVDLDGDGPPPAGVLTAEDVSCLVIPDGALGLPTLAALEQGIPVIAVRENVNVMANDLAELPWAPGGLIRVDNHWEAAGVVAALRAGIDPAAVRRPLADTRVDGRPVPRARSRRRAPAAGSAPASSSRASDRSASRLPASARRRTASA